MRRRAVLVGLAASAAGLLSARGATRRRRRPPPPPEDPPEESEPAQPPPAEPHQVEVTRPRYDPAPVPNQDAAGPTGPADESSTLAPTVFRNQQQFRGDAFSKGDSVQNSENRNNKPAVGFSLHVPQ